MKTTKLLAATALLIASASISFAGPGAQYWQQRRAPAPTTRQQTTVLASQSKTSAKVAVPVQNAGCQDCTSCKAKS